MRQRNWKEFWVDVLVDIVAGFLSAIGVYNFALNANFQVAGFSGSCYYYVSLNGTSCRCRDDPSQCAGRRFSVTNF